MENKITVAGEIVGMHQQFNNNRLLEVKIMRPNLEKFDYLYVQIPNYFQFYEVGSFHEFEGELRSQVRNGHLFVYIYALKSLPFTEYKNRLCVTAEFVNKFPMRLTHKKAKRVIDMEFKIWDLRGYWNKVFAIAWNNVASVVDTYFDVGEKYICYGQLQSRKYLKEYEEISVYEISVQDMRRENLKNEYVAKEINN